MTFLYDLERDFESDARRERLWARGGTLAKLLERLGAYTHHPIDGTSYHDDRGQGFPTANLRAAEIPRDPALPFAAYRHLLPCGPLVRALIAKHPSTPAGADAAVSGRAMLRVTYEELGTRDTSAAAASAHALFAMARDPSTPPELQVALAKDPDRSVRQAIANRPDACAEALVILAGDADSGVSLAVAENANAPLEALRIVAKRSPALWPLAVHLTSDAELLRELATTSASIITQSAGLKADFARHPNTPDDVLARLGLKRAAR